MNFKSFLDSVKRYRPYYKVKEIWFTLGSIIWFLICTYIVCLANSHMDKTNPSVQLPIDERTRLEDPLMDSVHPKYEDSTLPVDLPDRLITASLILIVIRLIVSCRMTFLLIRRMLYVAGIVYLLRAPFIIMTVLPNPLLSCVSHPEPNLFYDALLLMIQVRTSCGDVMYSGHTIIFLITGLVWVDFPIFKNFKLHCVVATLFICYAALCLLSLVVSSYHYTVDVVVALFIVLFFWKLYVYTVTTHTFDNFKFSKFLLFIDQERYVNPPETNPTPADATMTSIV